MIGPRRVLLATGADSSFAPLMLSCLQSLSDVEVLKRVEVAVLDQGLTAAQKAALTAFDARIATPDWPDFVPFDLRNDKTLGLAARPFLRDYFPGYDMYLWFDADAWAQSDKFLARYVEGALQKGAAVAREDGYGYRKSWIERRWWIGNHLLAFGPYDGLRLALQPSINIGIVALTSTAPHWKLWATYYKRTIIRTGKVNLDQHALHAAMCNAEVSTEFVEAVHNWLPILSTPYWNEETSRLYEPGQKRNEISVIHLAGPDKQRAYSLLGPARLRASLDYASFQVRLGREPLVENEALS
jgi:hypothetical protein